MPEKGLGRVCAGASLSVGAPGGAGRGAAVASAAPPSGQRRNSGSVSELPPLSIGGGISGVPSFELDSLGNLFYHLKQN